MKRFNVFMDDVRLGPMLQYNGMPGPFGEVPDPTWVIVRDIEVVKTLLREDLIENLSLDHDMGQDPENGYTLCAWMQDCDYWPHGVISVHSANPTGKAKMLALLADNGR